MADKCIMAFGACALLALSFPAQGEDGHSYDHAIKRLRGCIAAGSGGVAGSALGPAVTALRVLCRPQINVVYDASDRTVAAANPSARGHALSQLKQQSRAQIDRDLAILVSNMTGARP